MKTIAIVSDIHANHVALDAVLSDLESVVPDRVICLGDVAATGPGPAQVIDRLQPLGWSIVRGNCDDAILRYVAGVQPQPGDEHYEIDYWCSTQLSPKAIEFITTFQPVVSCSEEGIEICCYHGSPRSNLDELLPTTPDHDLDRWFRGMTAKIYVGGHTHLQMVRRFRDAFVINPGSVGLPYSLAADGGEFKPLWAEYAVIRLHDEELAIELRRIPVSAGAIRAAAQESEMPHKPWWVSDWR